MATNVRYAEIRFNDRPIKQQLVDPESFTLEPGEVTADYEARSPHRLDQLYPNIAGYRVVSTKRFMDPAEKGREEDKLWSKVWLLAGISSDIPNAGDWFRFDVGPQSLIIVRDKDNELNALYNVCKHRGNELVQEDFGQDATSFTCIMHSWRYNLKGKNVRVTDRDTFGPEALCQNLDLTPVHVQERAGLIFVSMAQEPMPFEDFYGDLLPMLDSYHLKDMFVVKHLVVDVPANWKTMYSVFNETYHAHATHPQIKPYVDDHFVQYDFYPNGHNRNLFAVGAVSPRWPDSRFINMGLAFFLQEAGVKAAGFKGDARHVRRAIQQAKRKVENPFGIDYSGFTDNQLTDDWNPSLFPNVTMNMHPEGVLLQRFRPHPTDPERGYQDVFVLSAHLAEGRRPPAYMGVEDDVDVSGKLRPKVRRTTHDDPQGGEVVEQDIANMVTLQRGMHSRGLNETIVFSEQERRIQQFLAELDLYLEDRR
ncbi:(2Fe-2S)-binding protein [Sphingobium lactosutens]|uniref:aromatic ring-hydroxylating oxygenase subunit alpha n=1 Tax=Sphingobium lactosutens TaxID=522773 RepID=UPI0015BD8811|nr:aromatic ring-hydroxylating dioxygenase subunit alpha [Sphingobium lactosutens]NWK98255.1 (2Fe-2S)-binding protein [Sphingobium lactosutens]